MQLYFFLFKYVWNSLSDSNFITEYFFLIRENIQGTINRSSNTTACFYAILEPFITAICYPCDLICDKYSVIAPTDRQFMLYLTALYHPPT